MTAESGGNEEGFVRFRGKFRTFFVSAFPRVSGSVPAEYRLMPTAQLGSIRSGVRIEGD
jgi:hypothetical protein